MKQKWLVGLLLAAVLLTGCSRREEQTPGETVDTQPAPTATAAPATQPPTEEVTEPERTPTYVAGSTVETETGGAVLQYRVPDVESCTSIDFLGENLLITSSMDNTVLTLLSGEGWCVTESVTLDSLLFTDIPSVQLREDGIGYFDSTSGSIVFRNEELAETTVISLPEGIEQRPVLSPDWSRVYYCTSEGVQVLDLQTGIAHLLRESHAAYQEVEGIFCDGEIVELYTLDDGGNGTVYYLDTNTGATVYTLSSEPYFLTNGTDYYLWQFNGANRELLCCQSGEIRCLEIPAVVDACVLPESRACVLVTSGESDSTLDYYDLTTGCCTSSVTLKGCWFAGSFARTDDGTTLYFLNSYDEDPVFYSWDLTATLTGDETDYTHPNYTAENPDLAGLTECRAKALELSQRYQVEVRIGSDAVTIEPWDYSFTSGYQVPAYQRDLALLEDRMAMLPEGFLAKAADGTDSGVLHICLVESIEGKEENQSLENVEGVSFWEGGEAYLVLKLGSGVDRVFCHELSHIIDNRVLSTCTAYDDWERLNPEGFSYDYDYQLNLERDSWEYLEGDDRAFIDTYSMSFPSEDRARIFEYAMEPDCGLYFTSDWFASDWMQRKLSVISQAIREAFDLTGEPGCYPWEQYLTAG